MSAAFAGAASVSFLVYFGLIIGAIFAVLVYVIIAVVIKFVGVNWIDKVMPAVVIGPTVALIGLSLAGNAVGNVAGNVLDPETGAYLMDLHGIICLVCGLITLAVTIVCSIYGKKLLKMIPFIIGLLSGYVIAAIFTGFSYIDGAEAPRIIAFSTFNQMEWYPEFTFLKLFELDYASVEMVALLSTVAVG